MQKQIIKLFISFADEDEVFDRRLETHLDPLVQQEIIALWHRQKIMAGQDKIIEVDRHLTEAHIILVLISPDFLASNYCQRIEVSQAIERHRRGEIRIIPVLLRPTVLEGTLFAGLQALPSNGTPLSQWDDKDAACVQIVEDVRRVIADIHINTARETVPETLWTIPYERNALFTGREDVLSQLHQCLSADGRAASGIGSGRSIH